ncbi:hypothetical protein EB73_16110 [Mycobacterium sp. SWH-M3]|nr:hypothetical protein EB73_16110 [Mycobacterium sp. SWH-M3]
MSQEVMTVRSKPRPLRRILASIGLGAASAAALLAIVGGVAGWATRSPRDFTSLSPVRMGIIAAAIGLLMLPILARALMGQKPTWTKTVTVASLIAVGLGVWEPGMSCSCTELAMPCRSWIAPEPWWLPRSPLWPRSRP